MEYIFLHGRPPAIMGDILKIRLPTYNLITCQELHSGNQKTVRYGTKTISFFGSKNLGNSSSKYKKVHLSELLCGIVDWRRAFTFISSRDLCQRGGERVKAKAYITKFESTYFMDGPNLSSGLDEWICAVVMYHYTKFEINIRK